MGTLTIRVMKTAELGEGLRHVGWNENHVIDEEAIYALKASRITQDSTNKVPKEFTVEQSKESGPYSILRYMLTNWRRSKGVEYTHRRWL